MKTDTEAPAPGKFSLVLGGPLYRLWRGTRLAGDALQLLRRRVAVLTLLVWAPLLALSVADLIALYHRLEGLHELGSDVR